MVLDFKNEEAIHKSASNKLRKNLLNSPFQLRYKLPELLKERQMSQKELAEVTGIRPQTITLYMRSEPDENGKAGLNLGHIFAIMEALRITDITDLIEVTVPDEIHQSYRMDRYRWISIGVSPFADDLSDIFIVNLVNEYKTNNKFKKNFRNNLAHDSGILKESKVFSEGKFMNIYGTIDTEGGKQLYLDLNKLPEKEDSED